MPTLNLTHLQQQYPSDCLSACAWMVLSYLDISIQYVELLEILDIQKTAGASMYNLNNLHLLGVTIDILDGNMDLLNSLIEDGHPVIAAVDTIDLAGWEESTTHAVVAAGVNDFAVFYHDPWFSDGPKSITRQQFESAWLYREYVCAVIQKIS